MCCLRALLRASALGLLVAAAAACGAGGGGGDGADAATPTLVLGTGLDSFVELRDGDPAELVAGPQGGYHVWVGVHFSGVPFRDVLYVNYASVDAGGAPFGIEIEQPTRRDSTTVLTGGVFERLGDVAVMAAFPPPPAPGTVVTIRAAIKDAAQQVLISTSRQVVLRDDVVDPPGPGAR
ncbi:MAG: hypothetical protein KBG28_24955 [Kofleriaceae bacterium]|jgi:hypothetical protein|nr:hypothetical protein [Kofleriaceae bacterium]MBP6841684.1 hypothetical protein [Kofleriaceae bacterium]MBP9207242.1 hypothetical protein [Kofleriaceae bacterium]